MDINSISSVMFFFLKWHLSGNLKKKCNYLELDNNNFYMIIRAML